jgi:hypothetical protein
MHSFGLLCCLAIDYADAHSQLPYILRYKHALIHHSDP